MFPSRPSDKFLTDIIYHVVHDDAVVDDDNDDEVNAVNGCISRQVVLCKTLVPLATVCDRTGTGAEFGLTFTSVV